MNKLVRRSVVVKQDDKKRWIYKIFNKYLVCLTTDLIHVVQWGRVTDFHYKEWVGEGEHWVCHKSLEQKYPPPSINVLSRDSKHRHGINYSKTASHYLDSSVLFLCWRFGVWSLGMQYETHKISSGVRLLDTARNCLLVSSLWGQSVCACRICLLTCKRLWFINSQTAGFV